ncbi:MAG: hypothetical protein QM737_13310 [Ferruginibacter sp.]
MSEHILLPEGSLEKETTTLNLGPRTRLHMVCFRIYWNWMESAL